MTNINVCVVISFLYFYYLFFWVSISKLVIIMWLINQRKAIAIADEIRSSYASNTSLVVHWDDKRLPDDGKQKVDRLPVIVTDPWRTAKLLGTTKLPAGTGQAIVNVIIYGVPWRLAVWQLSDCDGSDLVLTLQHPLLCTFSRRCERGNALWL